MHEVCISSRIPRPWEKEGGRSSRYKNNGKRGVKNIEERKMDTIRGKMPNKAYLALGF